MADVALESFWAWPWRLEFIGGRRTSELLGMALEAQIHWRTSYLRASGHGPGGSNSLADVALESFWAWPWWLEFIGGRRT